jgi:putative membrane protein insertion efficiency factor
MGKINQILSKVVIRLLNIYRFFLSPLLGNRCRFYPSCSCYAQEAVQAYGVIKGSRLVLMRLAKCHPFHPGGYDPIPELVEGKKNGL